MLPLEISNREEPVRALVTVPPSFGVAVGTLKALDPSVAVPSAVASRRHLQGMYTVKVSVANELVQLQVLDSQ